jgi:hypothetical protein
VSKTRTPKTQILGISSCVTQPHSDSDFKRVDEVCGLLAEKGTELGGPWSDHLEGAVWELRIRLRDVAARITYWRTAESAVRARKTCERDHRGSAAETCERQV